ncbi:MAG: MBL fold metallo-hydrolase [Proteobacteria bacterium]|nr:MBL fold metallo-hydrolase [Pseudomonadota bacterium]
MTESRTNSFLKMRPLFEEETCTHTFLLYDSRSMEGVLIDAVKEMMDRDINLIKELGVDLKYLLETHVHADHITSASEIRDRLGALVIYGASAGVDCADLILEDGEELAFGQFIVKAISTPGHTDGCTTYQIENMIFTGDTLLIRGCGRTDFQQGSSENLYNSVNNKLFTLPDDTIVYPAHDYKGMWSSTIGEEKKHNPRLGSGKTLEEFVVIMDNLNLAYPQKIDESVPANMKCGKLN